MVLWGILGILLLLSGSGAFRIKEKEGHLNSQQFQGMVVHEATQTTIRMCRDAKKALDVAVNLQCSGNDSACLDSKPLGDFELLPISVRLLRQMAASFASRCVNLDGGASSRSSAEFATTQDAQWVAKKVNSETVSSLRELLHHGNYREHLIRGGSMMLPYTFLVPESGIVVMPNFVTGFRLISESAFPGISMKPAGKFDVKPTQVLHSADRGDWLSELHELAWFPARDENLTCGTAKCTSYMTDAGCRDAAPKKSHGGSCWSGVEEMLSTDLEYFRTAADVLLIDYSLVFQLASAEGEHHVDTANLPGGCVTSYHQGRTLLLCVQVIDYLMQKSWGRLIESLWKDGKWEYYSDAVQRTLECSGDLDKPYCSEYKFIATNYPEYWSGRCTLCPASLYTHCAYGSKQGRVRGCGFLYGGCEAQCEFQ